MAGSVGRSASVTPKKYAVPVKRKVAHGNNHLSVREKLEQLPGSFAFAQAIDLVERRLRELGSSEPQKDILYRVNPNLSFPPGDIESINFTETQNGTPRAEVMLNLMGLHGSASPLPTYFTEFVAKHQDEENALRDFFDIFNHELISILYGVWRKYRYYLRYEKDATDILSQHFFGFIGLGHKSMRDAKNLRWSKLLSYSGLIAFKADSIVSLESILRHYFSHDDITVVPCIPRRVPIPEDQQARLGGNNSTLSVDLMLGSEVTDQTGKFRVRISSLNWKRFNTFLPDTKSFSELKTLLRFVLPTRLTFDVELRLDPDEIPPMSLGPDSVNRLGWSSWLGDGDGIVVLEPAHQEI